MKDMKLSTKLMLMLSIPIIGLLFFSINGILEKFSILEETETIQVLSKLAVHTSALVHELQKERGATAGFVGSQGKKFAQELPAQQADTDQKITELETFLSNFDQELLQKGKRDFQQAVTELARIQNQRKAIGALNIQTSEAIGYFTNMNALFLKTISRISGLSSDGKISTMLSSYGLFLQAKERAGIERAVVNGVFASKQLSVKLYTRVNQLINAQQAFLDLFLFSASPEQQEFYHNKMSAPSVSEVERMRALALGVLSKTEISTSLQKHFGYGGFIHFFKNYVIRGDQKYVEQFQQKYGELVKILERSQEIGTLTRADQENLEIIRKTAEKYRSAFGTVTELKKTEQSIQQIDAAIKISDGPAIQALAKMAQGGDFGVDPENWFRTITNKINLLKEVENKLSDDIILYTDQVRSAAQFTLTLFVVLALAVIIVAVITAVFITRNILKSLAQSRNVANQVAEGDLKVELAAVSSNEIGQLFMAMQKMIDALKIKVQLAQNISEGNLTDDVVLASEEDTLGKALQE